MNTVTADARPANSNSSIFKALSAIRVDGVAIANDGITRSDAIEGLLHQAQALTIVIGAAMEDADTLGGQRGCESVFETTRGDLKAKAMEGLRTLIGLAAALTEEGGNDR